MSEAGEMLERSEGARGAEGAKGPGAAGTARVKRWAWLALGAILVLALGLRVYHLGHESFWIDELYSLEMSTGHTYGDVVLPRNQVLDPPPHPTRLEQALPMTRMWGSFNLDQHPPLYFMLLRLWREGFGSSDGACRSLSVVFSLLAIALVFDVGRLLFADDGVALWASGMMAVAQLQIWYAQEARQYAMLEALMLAAVGALFRIERRGLNWGRGVALFAALLGIMLTHYFGAAGCVAIGVYALVRLRGKTRVRTVGLMAAAAVVWGAIWGPYLLAQTHGVAMSSTWLVDNSPERLSKWMHRLLVAPMRLFAFPPKENAALGEAAVLLLVLPALRLRRRPEFLLPLMWAVAWVALPAGIDLVKHTTVIEFPRYFLGSAPAVYLLASGLLSERRGWMRHVLPAVLVVYCVLSLQWTYENPKAEYRRLGQEAGKHVTDADLVVYYTPGLGEWFTGVPYLAVDHYAPRLSAASVLATKPLSAELLKRAGEARQVWLVTDVANPEMARFMPGYVMRERFFAWGIGNLVRLERVGTASAPATKTVGAGTGGGRGTNSSPRGRSR